MTHDQAALDRMGPIDRKLDALERRVAELEAENRRLWARINPPEWTKHHEKYAASIGTDRPGYNLGDPYDPRAGGAKLIRRNRSKP